MHEFYLRLNFDERQAYLDAMLGKDDESNVESDSEDEDWLPDDGMPENAASDSDEIIDNIDNQGFSAHEIDDEEDDEDIDKEEEEEGEGSESEAEDEAATAARAGEIQNSYIGKDKTVWNKTPPPQYQTASYNVVRQRSGPHRSTETLSISDTFKKILTVDMVNIICRHTNKKAMSVYTAFNEAHPDLQREWKPVTVQEMYSFIAILICSGVNNSNTDHTSDM